MKNYLRVVMRHPRPGRFLAARQRGFAVRFHPGLT